MPALLALLSSLLWGTSDFLGGTTARRLPVGVVVGLSQAVGLLVVLPFALTLGGRPDHVWAGPVSGVVGMVALVCFYRALATGTMGVVAPVASLSIVVPVVVGVATGDRPTVAQVLGIIAAVAGVVLASGPERDGSAPALPLLLALAAAAGFGTVVVLLAEGSKGPSGAVLVTLLTSRATSVLLLAGVGTVVRPALAPARRSRRPLVAMGVGDLGANGTYALASRGSELSVAAVLASLYPVVTVLLARRVHGERLTRVQVVGVALTLVGVALLALG